MIHIETFLFAMLEYSHRKDQNGQTGACQKEVGLSPEGPAEQVVMTYISHFFSPFRKKFSTALISMMNRNSTSAMENSA